MQDLNDEKARAKVWEMIKDIRIAQFVTHAADQMLAARPMAPMNREFEGSLYFFTKASAPKVEEIAKNPHVLVIYAEPEKQDYVSIQGTAEISNDRAKIAELWSEPARIWFTKGKDDPELRLVKVTVQRAEYWDSPSAALVMIYGYAMARITGKTPEVGENKKVAFR